MINHELHCTLNPNRECRMCELSNGVGKEKTMEELKAIFPADVVKALTETRDLTGLSGEFLYAGKVRLRGGGFAAHRFVLFERLARIVEY